MNLSYITNIVDFSVFTCILVFSLHVFLRIAMDVSDNVTTSIKQCKKKYKNIKPNNSFFENITKLNIQTIISDIKQNHKTSPPIHITPKSDDTIHDQDISATPTPPPSPPLTPSSSSSSSSSSSPPSQVYSNSFTNEITTNTDLRRSRRLQKLKPNYNGL